MAEETCDWTGISGRPYRFRVLDLAAPIQQEEAKGNYIYAKVDAANRWRQSAEIYQSMNCGRADPSKENDNSERVHKSELHASRSG